MINGEASQVPYFGPFATDRYEVGYRKLGCRRSRRSRRSRRIRRRVLGYKQSVADGVFHEILWPSVGQEMKKDYSALDAAILRLVDIAPKRVDAVLADGLAHVAASKVSRRRAGVSPAGSTDETIKERVQALRRAGKISYDRATSPWMREPPV